MLKSTLQLLTLFITAVSAAVAQVASYQPFALQGMTQISPPSGSAGTRPTTTLTYTRGTAASGIVTLYYSGPDSVSASAFLTSGTTSDISAAISSSSVIGHYILDQIIFLDDGGTTVYRRNGAIDRLFYTSTGMTTSHSINFGLADFDIVAPAAGTPGGTGGEGSGGGSTPTAKTGRAVALSNRGFVGSGDSVLVLGLSVADGEKTFAIRAVGPTLAAFGVSGFLSDPKLELRNDKGVLLVENNDWSVNTGVSFQLPNGSKDAALKVNLQPGNYTVTVSGVNNTTGVVLLECYELP